MQGEWEYLGKAEHSSHERPTVTGRQRKIRIAFLFSLLCFGLAVATLLPWSASIPNLFGYYSVCSFAPISTVMLFSVGLGFRFYGGRHGRMFTATVIVLAVLIGYSGYWAYTARMPISSLQLGIVALTDIKQWSDNSTTVRFRFLFYNPTDADTPAFEIEPFNVVINGTKLVPGTFDAHPLDEPYYVKAHQNLTNKYIDLNIFWNRTETEGGDLDTILLALNRSRFSLTLSGLLVERSWGLIVVASPFAVSYTSP